MLLKKIEHYFRPPIHGIRKAAPSFLYEGVYKTGCAVVSDFILVEAQALPTQATKQIALTHPHQLAKGQSLKLYTEYQSASSLRRMRPHTPIRTQAPTYWIIPYLFYFFLFTLIISKLYE